MNLNTIQNIGVGNKKVLLRVDFNVEIEQGKAKENFKIAAGKDTVKYLLDNGARVALISHLGRPDEKVNLEFSLEQLADEAEQLLGVKVRFITDCIGEKVKNGLAELADGEVLLLENVRFYPGEEKNDSKFAKLLAENFDVFVNDAFSVCHRDQASVTGIAKIIPSAAGLWLQKEITNLEKVKSNPEHPAVAIIGGAKIETKLPLIAQFEKNYDAILVGGRIANEAIDQKLSFSEKVMLPTDFVDDRLDIGAQTIENFKAKIAEAKTIIWNGPMGKFEEEKYAAGTREVLKAIISSGAFTLMGGGESVQLLEETGNMDKISFVSTGGGAMLEYLSGNTLSGIEVLNL